MLETWGCSSKIKISGAWNCYPTTEASAYSVIYAYKIAFYMSRCIFFAFSCYIWTADFRRTVYQALACSLLCLAFSIFSNSLSIFLKPQLLQNEGYKNGRRSYASLVFFASQPRRLRAVSRICYHLVSNHCSVEMVLG